MSRRRDRRQGPAAGKAPRGEPSAAAGKAPRREASPVARGQGPRGEPAPATKGLARDLTILIAVFAAAVGIAELAGAVNLGVALGVGQVAFAIALVVVLTRR